MESITIPNSVTSLSDNVFYGCSNLSSLIIPNSVTRIGDYSFYGCSNLSSLIIPNSVARIGDYSFYGCSNLSSLKVEWIFPLAVYENTFDLKYAQQCTLYVPMGCKSKYKNISIWSSFTNINEYTDDTNPEINNQQINYMTVNEAKSLIDGSKKYLFVEGFAGKYTFFYTVIGGGSITTDKYEYFVVSDEPNFNKSSRSDKDILSYNAILVGNGDTWLEEHPDLIEAINTGKRVRIQAIESWVSSRSYNMSPTKYEIIDEEEISAISIIEKMKEIEGYYDMQGRKLNTPTKGINIIKYKDGSTKKIIK